MKDELVGDEAMGGMGGMGQGSGEEDDSTCVEYSKELLEHKWN